MFWDFNSNELNQLTYGQKLTGVSKDDPNADTRQHRYGGSVGGPVVKRTFFYANYEGLRDKSIQGGGTITLPNAALRAGDFSASTIKIKDPVTGLPFPGNVIPADRISPIAKNIMSYFWPLPTRSVQATGMGIFQQDVPQDRKRERFDLRLDHEAGSDNQFFARESYQWRDPTRFQFEAGTASTDQPLVKSSMNTYAGVAAGPRSSRTNRLVNEVRVGYNFDGSEWKSNLKATAMAAPVRVRGGAERGRRRAGLPVDHASPAPTGRATSRTAAWNNNRTMQQNSFSVADNLSWMKGNHSLRGGVLVARRQCDRRVRPRPQSPRDLPVQRQQDGLLVRRLPLGCPAGWTSR